MFEQILAFVGPFVLGVVVGALVKRILSIALLIIALFIALMAFGYLAPEQVFTLLQQFGHVAKDALENATKLRELIPYTSIAFIIGLIVGLWRG
ncbi:MAG: hypothetical protein QW792_03025 [Pyrobaculum sp.]